MRCFYEVLSVERSADDSTIRTAYRKAALRWHPDKNQGNEEASERFKEVQNAWEVLSDPNERSWYDSHRESILRSGDRHQAGDSAHAEYEADVPEEVSGIFSFFTATAYSGFGDGPRGFYATYGSLFERMARKEAEAAERARREDARASSSRKKKPSARPMPAFGASGASWDTVSRFYSEWAGFATALDFAWEDVYSLAAAPNRRVRRAAEADNEKARRAARREFNENVRQLVAFVRKRDPRVAAHAKEEAARRAEQALVDEARRAAEREERAARARAYREAAWIAGGSDCGTEEEVESSEEEDELPDFLECVACEKLFRSQAALENHERSKKHRQRVEQLRKELEEDEGLLDEDFEVDARARGSERPPGGAGGDEVRGGSGEGTSEEEASEGGSSEEQSSREGASQGNSAAEEEQEEGSSVSEEEAEGGSVSEEEAEGGSVSEEEAEGGSVSEEEASEDDTASEGGVRGAKTDPAPGPAGPDSSPPPSSSEEEDSEDDPDAALERLLAARVAASSASRNARKKAKKRAAAFARGGMGDEPGSESDDESPAEEGGESDADDEGESGRGVVRGEGADTAAADEVAADLAAVSLGDGGARQGEGGGAGARATRQGVERAAKPSRAKAKAKKQAKTAPPADQVATPASCQVCGRAFPSRSRLFKHIAESGHAVLKR